MMTLMDQKSELSIVERAKTVNFLRLWHHWHMQTSDFTYHLPKNRIAQHSVHPRDTSRLLVFHRQTGRTEERSFLDFPSLLQPGDLLVVNNSKVFRARLTGKIPTGGKAEVFVLRPLRSTARTSVWEALVQPGKKCPVGTVLTGNGWSCTIVAIREQGIREVRFQKSTTAVFRLLARVGGIPVPPYVHALPKKSSQYQTMFASTIGSVAAPTAGFHFTPRIMRAIARRGVAHVSVTLHVGIGTFQPIKADDLATHQMHAEYAEISADTMKKIIATKKRGGRIVVVGTTATRALEGLLGEEKTLRSKKYAGWVNIFITPGYHFRMVDALLTNFHLPQSTLLVLVSAFAGRENILRTYRYAVRKKFRFFSFGDAMFLE